jgi:hypothetical protein
MLKRLFRISAPIVLAAVVGCTEEGKDAGSATPPAGEGGAATAPAPAAKPGGRAKTPSTPSENMPSNKMVD